MTWLEIRAQDVWLFRDGKPFSAGEDQSASSMFPPSPFTLQGALRRTISESLGYNLRQYKAATDDDEVVRLIGKHGVKDLGDFSLRGPFLSLDTGKQFVPLFPTPADLLYNDDKYTFRITGPSKQKYSTDLTGMEAFPMTYEGYENLSNHWVTTDLFNQYLKENTPSHVDLAEKTQSADGARCDGAIKAYEAKKKILPGSLLYKRENRFGVSTNALTSYRDEGLLYQVEFIRPLCGVGLLAEVGSGIPEKHLGGMIYLGGEQRRAHLTQHDQVLLPNNMVTHQFKVIFLTPAYFKGGWQPENADWASLLGEKVEFVSAVLKRPQKIGGWSSANGSARPMYNFVAPGSVYYFRTNNSESLSFPPVLTQSFDDVDTEALGFGQFVVGQWTYKDKGKEAE